MSADNTTVTRPCLLGERWTIFERTAPKLIQAIRPLMTHAPELLDLKPVQDAIFAVCLFKWRALADDGTELPRIRSIRQVSTIWSQVYEDSRYKSSASNWRIKIAGNTRYLWPYLDTALRCIAPRLPPDPRIPYDLERSGMLNDERIRAFLLVIATLIKIVGRAD